MSDATIRQAERAAAQGGPVEQAHALAAALRAGQTPGLAAYVELQSMLGEDVARLVTGGKTLDESRVRELCSNPEHGLAFDSSEWGRMCYVPCGESLLGSLDDDRGAYQDEKPQRRVHVCQFWIAQRPATLEQWRDYIAPHRNVPIGAQVADSGSIGNRVSGDTAVINVSWNDVTAALGRTTGPDSSSRVVRGGSWFNYARACRASHRFRLAPVLRYDYCGFRVCLSPSENPQQPTGSGSRVARGGSWFVGAAFCRPAYRFRLVPAYRNVGLGFRSTTFDGLTYRLPHENEWERAVRGWDGRCYPWGEQWIDSLEERRTRPSPFGLYDCSGEVWQWCQNEYVADRRPLIQQSEEQK